MQLKLLLKELEGYDIDTSMFPKLYEEYFKRYASAPKDYEFREEKGIFVRLEPLMQAFRYFRPHFSESEFSKLVCKKIISYGRIHCICLTGNPQHPELYAGTYARPRTSLPKDLIVTCSKTGIIKMTNRSGYPPKIVRF